MRLTLRSAIASFALVALAAAFTPILASAQLSTHHSMQSNHAPLDFGIASLRQQLLGGHSGAVIPAAKQTAPLGPCPGPGVWQRFPTQNGSWNNELGGIAAASPTDMWVVGSSQSATPPTYGPGHQNFAEHWDGKFWSMVPTPQPGADDNILNDVAAASSNDVWAVGVSNTTGGLSATALHWTGSAWSTATLPTTPLNGPTVLNDVVAFSPTDVWAVGQMLATNSTGTNVQHPYIVHWDGSSWTRKDNGTTWAGEGDNVLYGVGGSSTTDLYAVGYSRATPSSLKQELALHWNGATWSAWAGPAGAASRELTSVAALSTSDAMAVGYISGSGGTTLAERSTDGGVTWTSTGISTGSAVNLLADIAPVAPSSYNAVGFSRATTSSGAQPLYGVWSGTWSFSPGETQPSGDTFFFSIAVPAANDPWAVGSFLLASGLSQNLIETNSSRAAPMNVSAVPGDQSVTVTWTPGLCDGGSAVTSYIVFAYDGCSVQSWMPATASPAVFSGLTNGTAYNFRVAAVNSFGTGQQSQATSPVTPSGTAPTWVTACSDAQYPLTGSNGTTWQDMDAANLTVSFKPAADSWAVVSGNADLWTANAGYNQDIGVYVSGDIYPTVAGQPEAWKESGGLAGTYSPNAAFVQKAILVKANTQYSAKLQWKASFGDPGMIAAGAGPIPTTTNCLSCPPSPQSQPFSPTRLSVLLIPTSSAVVFNGSTTEQKHLSGSNGSTWVDMDATNLSVPFTPPAGSWTAYISGNADLWTQQAGYNQDIGITLTGGGYPSVGGQPEAWKESGGFAGIFSPNAAFVQTAVPVTGGTTYTAKLQWKANGPDPGTIFAGAGPVAGTFSPTSLTVLLVPNTTGATAAITGQPSQTNSDGAYWQPVDPALSLTLTPSAPTSYLVTANADLWTTVAGFNQDIGIMVSGGAYGGGFLVAWKESGGLAGTFSPNAAFVSTALHLQPSTTYKVWAVWKTNQISLPNSSTIKMGAGPIGPNYSPTRLSAMQLSQP